MTEIASLYAEIGARTDGFTRAMNGVDDRLHGINRQFGALGAVGNAVMVGIGAAIAGTTVAVAGFGAAIVSSTMAAADMEQQIANISAVMGLTADEAATVGDLINDLGIDPNLKVSATEAGQAIEMLARNGLELQDMLDGAAHSTVLLANATGGNFSMAADVATDAMAQFGIKAADMMSAVNGIVGVTVSSKFTIDDYRLALAQAGGVASAVGVSFKDFNTAIAATAPSFASGSDAGTAFKTFLQRMIPQSKQAEEAMRALGIITADGSNRFFDASGNMRDMSEIVGVLNEAFSGLTEEQRNATAATIFGTDAMRTAFGLAGMTAAEFEALQTTLGETDAAAAAATRMDTLSGSMEILRGVFESVQIQIGQKFLPLATRLTRWATDIATRFARPLLDWFGRVAESIDGMTARLSSAWNVNGMAGMVREVQAMAGELAAAFGGWAANAWTQTQRNLNQWFANLVTWVTDPAKRSQVLAALTSGWTMFADWAGNLYGGVLAGVRAMFSNLYAWIADPANRQRALSALTDTWTMFADWAGALWDSMTPPLAQTIAALYAWATDPATWRTIGDAIADTWTFFTDWAGAVWGDVAPGLQQFAADVWAWATDGSMWQGIVDGWTFLVDWLTNVWGNAAPRLQQFAADLWQWATDGSMWQGVTDGWTFLVDWLADVWSSAAPKLAEFVGDVWAWATDGSMWQGITDTWTMFADWAGDVWGDVGPKLAQFAADVWKWISDPATWQRFHQAIADRWNAFSAWAGGAWATVQPKLIQFGADVQKWIDGNAPDLAKWIAAFGDFGEGVLRGWNAKLPQLEQRLSDFSVSVEASLNRIADAFRRVFGGDGTDGVTGNALGNFVGAMMSDMLQGALDYFENKLEALSYRLQQMAYTWEALQAAIAGDWAAALELLKQASTSGLLANDADLAGGAIQDAIDEAIDNAGGGGRQGGRGGFADVFSAVDLAAPEMPDIVVPEVAAPEMPDIVVPEVAAPNVDVNVTVPKPPPPAPIVVPDWPKQRADIAPPTVKIPPIKAPDVAMALPELATPDMPDITMPELAAPEMPDIVMPELATPDMPDITMPELPTPETPDIVLPELATPDMPDIALPEMATPDMPTVNMPELATPDMPTVDANITIPKLPAPAPVVVPDWPKQRAEIQPPTVKIPTIKAPDVSVTLPEQEPAQVVVDWPVSERSMGGSTYHYEGDTINVYINGQPAAGDVRTQARLGVAEALRARGAQ